MKEWQKAVALIAALGVFLGMVFGLRMVNVSSLLVPAIVWLGFFLVFYRPTPKDSPQDKARPENETDQAVLDLDQAADQMQALARRAGAADSPLFARMADLLGTIRDHHTANPDHAARTRRFRKHVIGRMIQSVSDYLDLSERAGSAQQDRLADVSRQLEAFVPALEKIDRACLENDLTALEINVEVLGDQIDRKGR